MQEVADWLHEVRGTPKTCTVEFIQFDASFGKNNGVRLSNEEWTAYSGHLGHMHAPENVHGDPGLPFPIDLILGTAEEDFDMATGDEILTALQTLREDLTVFGTPGLEKTVEDFASRQRDTLKKLDQLSARLTKIEQHLGIPS